MRTNLHAIESVTLKAKVLNPPVGFTMKTQLWANQSPFEIPAQKQIMGTFFAHAYEYYVDGETRQIAAEQESTGALRIGVNDMTRIYPNTDRDEIVNLNFPCPVFFMKTYGEGVSRSDDVIEYKDQDGFPVIAVTNGKPLFIPLTKAQYLAYEIAEAKAPLGSNDDLKNMENALLISKKQLSEAPADQQESLKQLVATEQHAVEVMKASSTQYQEKINNYQHQLQAMTSAEKNAPAYIIWGSTDPHLKAGELAGPGDPDKQELFTTNPGYFNPALPLSDIQLITVEPFYNPRGVTQFMLDKIMEAYHTVDYGQLKALIKK